MAPTKLAVSRIGLGQARQLCQMPQSEVTDFLAKGLPVIYKSAQNLSAAAEQLKGYPRERAILLGHAAEEAAKILILIDLMRCPKNKFAQTVGNSVRWFYHHGARLMYAQAAYWRPMDLFQLREYVDRVRKSHSLIGNVGEHILPNWNLYEREALLYADVEAAAEGVLLWSDPVDIGNRDHFKTGIIELIESMSKLGFFSREGVSIIESIWGAFDYYENQPASSLNDLIQETLKRIIDAGLPSADADDSDIQTLYSLWQMPMYSLQFQELMVSTEELNAEQDRLLWQEAGYP